MPAPGTTPSAPPEQGDSPFRTPCILIRYLDKTIKAVGGKGLADMVTMTVFINDEKMGNRFVEIRKEVFKECFPASALITVTGFARAGLLVEVQGIAVIGGK